MTQSRSITPLAERRELHESVQELDNLLEDLNNARMTDERSHTKRLHHQKHLYSSTSSLNTSTTMGGRRYVGADGGLSPAPLQKIAASTQELDTYTSKLESELSRDLEDIPHQPRGVLVKDVVQEEILVDHVPVPKAQQMDKKFVTRASERRRASGAGTGKGHRVAFHELEAEDDAECYDNTDNEQEDGEQQSMPNRGIRKNQQSSSMTSLNSAMTDQSELTDTSSVIDPGKIINCHACSDRVVGQVITALGRNYHKEHFTCAHCSQELGTRNFYERDNLPYCEKDYQALFSPKCAACTEPILDKVTIALEQTFHPEHFVCAYCGCQFDVDDGFHEKDGRPYCKTDYFELFANKCAGCNIPIAANYITALGVQWHPDCFVCSDCHCPFTDGKFFDIDGAPYCEIHYHARRGSLCAVCRQPIIGTCTTAMFRKFHPDHFTCTYCLKVLNKSFKEENDKPYCHDCFDKLYS